MSVTLKRNEDAAFYTFSGISESYNPTVTATDHPIEEGADVTDHVRLTPESFSITVLETESPFAPAEGSVVAGEQRLRDALDFLRGSQRKLLSVVTTRNGTFTNCVLLNFSHSFDNKRRLQFEFSFKQLRIAKALSVLIPPKIVAPAVKSGAPTQAQLQSQALLERSKALARIKAAEDARAEADKSQLYRAGEYAGVTQ